jgi:adenylate cyclase
VARRRGFSRFVGRADEMATLELAFHRATEGDGQVVGVVGEAGVGKSRLCLEFVERCSAKGVPVNQAHCPAHGKAVPLLPVLELLRNVFSISEQDTDRVAREKITGRLVLLDRQFEEVLPLIFDFLGVSDPESPAPPIDPEVRQRRLFDFVRRLVQKTSEREPTVLLVDDLHWIDAGSDDFLAQAVEAVSGTRTILLVNFRPEYQAEWVAKSHFHQLPLAPLGIEAIGELLDDLLGRDPSLGALRERIRERTGGNPFFIEEVVQSLMESGSLEGARGDYRLVGKLEEVEIPATVQSLLAARIDRLDEREKRVLQLCAVIGEDLRELLIERVAEHAGPELAEALRSLVQGEFLYERTLYPELKYGFKHALTRDVAYESQLRGRRARVHAAVAKALEELHPEVLDEKAALLAHHWEQAGESLEAARWHARAAGWVVRSDREAAHEHWLQVRRLLAELEDSTEKLGLDLMACGQLMWLDWTLGATADEVEALFAEGKALAERVPNAPAHRLLQMGYANYVGQSGGDIRRYVSAAREAVQLAEASREPGHRLAAKTILAIALIVAGNPTESLELLGQCVAHRPEDPLAGRGITGFSQSIRVVMLPFWPLGLLGRLGEADDALRQGIELAREHGELELVSLGLGLRVRHGEWSGETATTLASARQGVEIAERTGVPLSRSFALVYLGNALRLEQRYQEALEVYEKALDLMRTKRVALLWKPVVVSGQALVDSALGAHEKAIAQARSALEECVEGGNRRDEGIAHLTLARVLLAAGDPGLHDEAQSTVESAEALCHETGMRVDLPPLLEVRAALAERRGDPQEVRRRLREAHHLYTEMGATGHAERLAGELGL